jgi:calcineurin-like phosphoesterase family protein
MTKLRVVSDLHVEFHADKGIALLDEIITSGEDYDILVLAGDISDYEHLPATLEQIAKRILREKKNAVYVMGNHEAYGGSIASALGILRDFEAEHPSFKLLENESCQWHTRGGAPSFAGTTLWYPHPQRLGSDSGMGDFNHIKDDGEIHSRAMTAKSFLFDVVKQDNIVVTHFLPHPKSILPQWQGSSLNGYFLHDNSPVVCGRGAKLWIHGHTHGSLDYMVAAPGASPTRVVCNPLGYARGMRGEPNPAFNPTLTIEV